MKKRDTKQIFYYLKKRFKENLLLVILIVCSVTLKISSAFLTSEAFNHLLASETELFIQKVIFCALLYFSYTILFAFQTWYEVYVRQKILSDIRKHLISVYSKQNILLKDYASGRMIAWLTTDMERINNEGFRNFYRILEAIIDISLSLIALFVINWILMVSIVILDIINLILPKMVDRKITDSFRQLTSQQEVFTSSISNLLRGFPSLFSLNKQSFFVRKIEKDIEEMSSSEIKTYKTVGFATFLAAFGNDLGQVGSLIISGFFVAKDLLTFGDILSVSSISVSIFNGVSNFASSIIELKGIYPIFQKHHELDKLILKEDSVGVQKCTDLSFQSQLQVKNLQLSYQSRLIFSDANFTINKGEKWCLIGPSGSGKSTLFQVLNGSQIFDSGLIRFDDYLIGSISSQNLRENITYVEQSPFIFQGTLMENLILDGKFSPEKVTEVLDKVGLKDDINQLIHGLETIIGDKGIDLSGGQKQRLALARALLNGSDFLLLDESTSNLNASLANSVEEGLLSDPNYTIIQITHHLKDSMIPLFDHIIELRDGKLKKVEVK